MLPGIGCPVNFETTALMSCCRSSGGRTAAGGAEVVGVGEGAATGPGAAAPGEDAPAFVGDVNALTTLGAPMPPPGGAAFGFVLVACARISALA